MNQIIDILKDFANKNNESIKILLKANRKSASGKLAESLGSSLSLDVERLKWELELTGINYVLPVRDGRRKQAPQPPTKDIQNWMRIRGIDIKYTVPIKRSIAEKGIPAFDFVDMIFTDESYDKLGQSISDVFSDQITKTIKYNLEEK